MQAFCELSPDGKRIEVRFPYSIETKDAVKRVPGSRFVPAKNGNKAFWTVPADLDAARRLREEVGMGLELGERVKAWGRDEIQRRRNLDTLTTADDAELSALPGVAPELAGWLRPYQRADTMMMAQTNVLNANQPGTGKTVEVIAALAESGLLFSAPHIVVAPVKSLVNVWAKELREWFPHYPIFTAEDPAARKVALADGLVHAAAGAPCMIIVNAEMVRAAKSKSQTGGEDPRPVIYRDHKGREWVAPSEIHEQMYGVKWGSVTIDEFHKMGLNNRTTLLHIGLSQLKGQRRFALSGTPMGGKPRKLWPVLNWLEPELYSGFWKWAELWLEVDDNGFGKTVSGIMPGREEDFYAAHARHMVRRLKRDALPGLPPKVMITVECGMTKNQAKLYKEFERDAEVQVEGGRISARMLLAEYTRLKQFANAACVLRDDVVTPTTDSDKLEQLIQKLDEEGVRKDDPEPGARAIVASESKRFVKVVVDLLREKGIACDELSGDTKDSAPIIDRFQGTDPEPYVIVMTIQTGGVSLNLQAAGSIHALDESWNPDDMEQLFDRADRGSRETPLRCYTYRTRGTIQEAIAEVAESKAITNANVLDVARQIAKRKREA